MNFPFVSLAPEIHILHDLHAALTTSKAGPGFKVVENYFNFIKKFEGGVSETTLAWEWPLSKTCFCLQTHPKKEKSNTMWAEEEVNPNKEGL